MNQIEINNFKQSFLSTPIFNYLKADLNAKDEIIAIIIQGSTLSNLDTENSDIDLRIYTKNTNLFNPSYTLEYKNKHVHWWYRSITTATSVVLNQSYAFLELTGFYNLKFLTEDDIIYINPKYPKIKDLIIQTKDKISVSSIFCLYELTGERLLNNFSDSYIPKWSWVFIDYYYSKKNKAKDALYRDGIPKLKHKRFFTAETEALKPILQEGINMVSEDYDSSCSDWTYEITKTFKKYIDSVDSVC